jgi:hypothetical protein
MSANIIDKVKFSEFISEFDDSGDEAPRAMRKTQRIISKVPKKSKKVIF